MVTFLRSSLSEWQMRNRKVNRTDPKFWEDEELDGVYDKDKYKPTGSMSAQRKRLEQNKFYQGESKKIRKKVRIKHD